MTMKYCPYCKKDTDCFVKKTEGATYARLPSHSVSSFQRYISCSRCEEVFYTQEIDSDTLDAEFWKVRELTDLFAKHVEKFKVAGESLNEIEELLKKWKGAK